MEDEKVTRPDPAEIDLEVLKALMPRKDIWSTTEVKPLITAVEALRDLVGGLNIDLVNAGHDNEDAVSRAETAEAHAVELAGALENLTYGLPNLLESIGYSDEEQLINKALATLKAMPPEALERSRARDDVVKWARLVLVDHNAIGTMNDALAKLDTLQGKAT